MSETGYTVSFHHGEVVNQAHNRRDPDAVKRANDKDKENGLPEHIKVGGKHETWLDMTPEKGCHKILDEAVENYNKKQKRKDRKTSVEDEVNKYMRISKTGMTREVILTVGNVKEHPDDSDCRTILRHEYQEFKRKNPNLQIIGAYYHNDEPGSAPHLHIDYIPWHSKRQRGLDKQIGLKGALEDMGYSNKGFSTKEDREKGALKQWTEDMRELCKKVVRENGFDVKKGPDKEKKEHQNTTEYKKSLQTNEKDIESLEQEERELKSRLSELKLQTEYFREERNKANNELQESNSQLRSICDRYKGKPIKYKKNLHGLYLVPEEDILAYQNISSEVYRLERIQKNYDENIAPNMRRMTRLERDAGRLQSELDSEKLAREKDKQQVFEDISRSMELTPNEVRRLFERGRYDRLAEQNPWKDIPLTLPKSGKLTDKQKVWIEKMLESQLRDGKTEHNWMVVASREVGRENFIQKMKQEIIKSIERQGDSCAEVDKAYRKHTSKIASKFYGNGNVFSTLWNLQNQVQQEADYSR